MKTEHSDRSDYKEAARREELGDVDKRSWKKKKSTTLKKEECDDERRKFERFKSDENRLVEFGRRG
jgi:hypothetical protein